MKSIYRTLANFDEILEGNYAGQEEARFEVRTALTSHMLNCDHGVTTSTSSATGAPLHLHFVGPTGTGKTKLAIATRDALSEDESSRLTIKLQHNWEKLKTYSVSSIKKRIVVQLQSCSRSIIIFDEFQFATKGLILALKEAFDENDPTISANDVTVRTSCATFIFCSDFTGDQQNELTADLAPLEARNKVLELAQRTWKFTEKYGFGKLFVARKESLIPFIPFVETELRKVIKIEFDQLDEEIRKLVRHQAKASSIDYIWRGQVQWSQKYLEPRILVGLREDISLFNARAIRNGIAFHLRVHATKIAQCLTTLSARRTVKGFFYGQADELFDNVYIADVDDSMGFSVNIGSLQCIVDGEPEDRRRERGQPTKRSSTHPEEL